MDTIARTSFLLFFFTLIITSCTENSAKEKEKSQLQNKENLTTVRTVDCSVKVFDHFIYSTGKIKPVFEQKINSPLEGKINTCALRNGSHHKQGQILITYYTEAFDLRLQRALTNLYKTKMDFESYLMGYSSKKNVADTVVQLLKASSGLTQAELEVKEIQFELKKATITAPFDGRIANVKIQKGWQVKSGQELFTIYSDCDLFAEVKVLETDFALVKLDYPAEVVPVSNSGKKYTAKVFEINPHVDENGMVAIKLKLLNTDGLLPGMNANTIIRIPDQRALIVPRDAVILRSGKAVVFTMEDGLAKWNYVTTGRENGVEVEIQDGLKSGQKVIVTNNLQLAHDAPVKDEGNN